MYLSICYLLLPCILFSSNSNCVLACIALYCIVLYSTPFYSILLHSMDPKTIAEKQWLWQFTLYFLIADF